MSDEITPQEYLGVVTRQIRELLVWHERWERRTPDDEAELRQEWERLKNQAEMTIAAPVEGERR